MEPSDSAQHELRVKVRFHEAADDREAGPVTLRVHPDGAVEVEGRDRVEPGGRVRSESWTIAVEKSVKTWAGPELLIIPPAGGGGARIRCPLPESPGSTVLLGRSRRACDITLYDDHVSRVHLKISLTENGYSVEDMQSKWGTMFNGRPMQSRTLLGHGDELRVGSTVVRFLRRWDEAAAREPRPIDTTDLDLFESAETHAGPVPDTPAFGARTERSPRPPSSAVNSGARRPAPTLYIGMGLGLMIAIVGVIVWTLVSWLWPAA